MFNLAILSRLISARRMGGELSKSKHGGDSERSGVEYVSSGNKLIKKRKKKKKGGERGRMGIGFARSIRVFYDAVDKWMISFMIFFLFFFGFFFLDRVLIFIEIVRRSLVIMKCIINFGKGKFRKG